MQKVSRAVCTVLVLLLFPFSASPQRLSLSGIYGVSAGGTGLSSTTINQILYSSAANTIAGLATANNGVLITSGAGVPSISSTIPSATQDNITRLGTLTTNLIFTDNLYDIGASGATRPRNLFLSGDATIGDQLIVSGTGPHVLGGTTNPNIGLHLAGTFSGGGGGLEGLDVGWTITPAANQTATGINVAPTLAEAASGVHAALVGLNVNPTITPGVATATDFFGIRVQSTAVATGTTTATGLSVAAPTGASTNYAVSFSGVVNITSGTVRTACTTVAGLPAGVVGDHSCVNDQLTSCPVLSGTFTGGGAVVCSAFYNGTAWVHE